MTADDRDRTQTAEATAGTATDERDVVALIPAYNAAHLVAPVVGATLRHLPVIVVDDGSDDDTAEVAERAGARVVRQTPNQGKGAALKNGFRHALDEGYQAVLTLDADGQHDPTEAPRFLDRWREARPELIIGARDFSEMPLVRRLSNRTGRALLNVALGRDVPDNQSGYRLISRPVMEGMLEDASGGFEFEVWMVVLCEREGWTIDWVPIRTIYEGQGSHIRPVEHLRGYFSMMWRIWKERRGWTS